MKKISLAVIILFGTSISYAQVDYSQLKQQNPYSRYEFKSGEEWREIKRQELIEEGKYQKNTTSNVSDYSYFSQNITNPINASRKVTPKSSSGKGQKNKYQHLQENQHRIGACWDKAASTYNLDPWLLMAIAKTESSFNPNAVNAANRNGSVDYGMMQINSIWLPTLKKHKITKDDLFEPCVSIFVGAWIMAQNIKQFGYNIDGIGAYNSPGNIKIRRNYASKVYTNYSNIVADLYKK